MSRRKFQASDGLPIAYRLDDYTDPWKPAETVILVHAAMGSSGRFYAWIPHLAGAFRVLRIDLRGHGGSGIPGPDQLSVERIAATSPSWRTTSERGNSTWAVLPPDR